MKNIKEKVRDQSPKIRNPASRLPKELVRSAMLETKEKSSIIADKIGRETGEESPVEYAGNRIQRVEQRAGKESVSVAYRGGKKLPVKTREKLMEQKQKQREAATAPLGGETAIMMQESGGRGTDPMQASECPYNTQYPNTPGAIQDADYSIKVGVQYYADCVREAGCQSPQDMDKLKLSWQGYNYGNGYISWALEKFGGYSEANALQFSQEQAAAHGWSGYGDPEYVPHVMRYYSGSGWFVGLFGNGQLVTIAKSQLGNEGGQKFWLWYGFTSREEWCACFVSWCADQAGLIQKGAVPKFSLCTAGVDWFQAQGKWQSGGSIPTPGTIIFFDWNHDGSSDHVGIVESCDGTTVHTIEGNSGDAVRQNSYTVNSQSILGYGLVAY